MSEQLFDAWVERLCAAVEEEINWQKTAALMLAGDPFFSRNCAERAKALEDILREFYPERDAKAPRSR